MKRWRRKLPQCSVCKGPLPAKRLDNVCSPGCAEAQVSRIEGMDRSKNKQQPGRGKDDSK